MCFAASNNFNTLTPTASVKNINWFQKEANSNDEVSMTLNISAELSSLVTLNTKQVFVFVTTQYEAPQNALNQGMITKSHDIIFEVVVLCAVFPAVIVAAT